MRCLIGHQRDNGGGLPCRRKVYFMCFTEGLLMLHSVGKTTHSLFSNSSTAFRKRSFQLVDPVNLSSKVLDTPVLRTLRSATAKVARKTTAMSTEENVKAKVLKAVPASLRETMTGLRTKAVSLMMIGQAYRANVEDQCSLSLWHQSA